MIRRPFPSGTPAGGRATRALRQAAHSTTALLLSVALVVTPSAGWRAADLQGWRGALTEAGTQLQGSGARLLGRLQAAGRRLALPFAIARLQMRPPDARLLVPVAGLGAARIADTWQAPRDGGRRRHEGQDLFAPRGTSVHSATAGYVMRVGENPLGGRSVWVIGAGGRRYYYAHLDAWAPGLSIGDRVEPGTLLGRVGNTGNARGTPPHLHFGVYGVRGAIDPRPMLIDGPA